MKINSIRKGYARVKVPFNKYLRHSYGTRKGPSCGGIHGGVLASAGDAAVGAALATLIDPYDEVATIELNINYIAPVKLKGIIAEGRIISKRHNIAVGNIKIVTESEASLVGIGLATFKILGKRGNS
jgi:uncharacterized protein (TIGR00369 family)